MLRKLFSAKWGIERCIKGITKIALLLSIEFESNPITFQTSTEISSERVYESIRFKHNLSSSPNFFILCLLPSLTEPNLCLRIDSQLNLIFNLSKCRFQLEVLMKSYFHWSSRKGYELRMEKDDFQLSFSGPTQKSKI